ncbi:uncharacterized protein PAC_03989 [Phialocephala subalpina]|uniref:Uncharacterized protein n=1 Tax=Phialocephala subalpina TaxID=576137 RepID=A0A1L7WMX1_9HELO|nr:uncharacterized protein PAC_03989 [Phialocephala subalpina]
MGQQQVAENPMTSTTIDQGTCTFWCEENISHTENMFFNIKRRSSWHIPDDVEDTSRCFNAHIFYYKNLPDLTRVSTVQLLYMTFPKSASPEGKTRAKGISLSLWSNFFSIWAPSGFLAGIGGSGVAELPRTRPTLSKAPNNPDGCRSAAGAPFLQLVVG